MKLKSLLYILILIFGGCSIAFSAWAETKNAGLGPLEMRTQFPVTQQFLSMSPENTATMPEGESQFTYNVAFANTFINTQAQTKQITRSEAENGITLNDFLDTNGNVVNGFSLYIDVESKRETLQYKKGWTDFIDLTLEIPFVSFGGGVMDSEIEGVHDALGVGNSGEGGAYRSLSAKNQFDYYVVKDNQTIYGTSDAFNSIRGETSIGMKWSFSEGSESMPAISLKLSYKFGNSDRAGSQKYVRSGSSDWGYYLLFSKGYEDWIVYFGDGSTHIGESNGFSSILQHRFMAMEHRLAETSSIVFQSISQSSIFPTPSNASPRTTGATTQEERNFHLNTLRR